MPKLDATSLLKAKESLLNEGDTDLFPKLFEIEAIDENWDMIENNLLGLDNILSYNWIGGRRIIVPKGKYSFRSATQLDPIDSLVLTSLIHQYGTDIERSRIPIEDDIVFSYRFDADLTGSLYNKDINWNTFWVKSLEKAKEIPDGYVLIADISDFYNQISHHQIKQELLKTKIPNEIASSIEMLLSNLTQGVSKGIPIGPHPSHLIAEISTNAIDRSLIAHGYRHCRFVDDINIFCENYEQAEIALHDLVYILDKHQRLIIQKHKTSIKSSDEFIKLAEIMLTDAHIDDIEENILRVIEKYSSGNPYKSILFNELTNVEKEFFNKEKLETLFSNYLNKPDPNFLRLRWLLRRLSQVGAPDAIPFLISHIKELTPAFGDLCIYLTTTENTYEANWDEIGKSLISSLELPIVNHNEYLQMTLINLFSRISNLNHIEELLSIYQRSHLFVKRKIIKAATKANQIHWLQERKEEFTFADPWLRRAFLLGASTFSDDEKKYWLKRIERDVNTTLLEKVVSKWVRSGGSL